jgi:hypothetical protein
VSTNAVQVTDSRLAYHRRIIKEINMMSDEEFVAFAEADAQEYKEYLMDLQDLRATVGGWAMNLFETAFCGTAHEAQQAGRAALRVGDRCVVMVTSERRPRCHVYKTAVREADARYIITAGGRKFYRSGKATGQRKSARVSRTLYAVTPEVEAWFAAKGK